MLAASKIPSSQMTKEFGQYALATFDLRVTAKKANKLVEEEWKPFLQNFHKSQDQSVVKLYTAGKKLCSE